MGEEVGVELKSKEMYTVDYAPGEGVVLNKFSLDNFPESKQEIQFLSIEKQKNPLNFTLKFSLKTKINGEAFEFLTEISEEMVANGTIDIAKVLAFQVHKMTGFGRDQIEAAINMLTGGTSPSKNPASEIIKLDKTLPNVAFEQLPAMDKLVKMPCACGVGKSTLYSVIQHLNDVDKWSRERIADWIDRLHDAGIINAEFKPWGDDSEPDKPGLDISGKMGDFEKAMNAFNETIKDITEKFENLGGKNEDKDC